MIDQNLSGKDPPGRNRHQQEILFSDPEQHGAVRRQRPPEIRKRIFLHAVAHADRSGQQNRLLVQNSAEIQFELHEMKFAFLPCPRNLR